MANNFAGDARIIDFWRFENNLTAGKNGNDLTASAGGVGYESGAPLEGAYSLSLTRASAQYAYRNDADLSADFPLKDGDSDKKGMWFCRFKPAVVDLQYQLLLSKSSSTSRSFQVHLGYDDLQIWWGNSGSTYTAWYVAADIFSAGGTYSIGVIFDGVNKTCTVRLYNHATATFTTYTKTFAAEMQITTNPFCVGRAVGSTNYFGGIVDEVVAAIGDWTVDEIDQIIAGTFGAAESIALYGRGLSQAEAGNQAAVSISLKATGQAISRSDAPMIGVFCMLGAGLGIAENAVITGKILNAFGLSETSVFSEALGLIVSRIYGQSEAQPGSDAYLRRSIDVELWADPNLIVKFRPHIGGGGVLTYRAGAPDAATYWDLVGVGDDGFDEPPHGSLRWHYVRADKAGLAANIYIAPTDPALAGHRDRIFVRRADA